MSTARNQDGEGRSERGATAVEYALMVSLIALVIIGGAYAFGTALGISFTDSCTAIFGTC